MSCNILFTSIGMTDPISHNRDGAILQICRRYKPERIYMFLSQQITENHIRDNRYCLSIQKLRESLADFDPVIEIIANKNLFHVHKFDVYYEIFESQIEHIREEFPEHRILLNISSGTPAMKNALNLIAALHDSSIVAVQVSTPETEYVYRDYDIEAAWKGNLDNDPTLYQDRTNEERNLNLTARIKKEMILKHISVYDYQAAYAIAQDIKGSIPLSCMNLIKAACCRIQLDEYGMKNALEGTEYDFIPNDSGQKRNITEYLLWLQIKQLRQDYADFIRGITPVAADLFDIILEHHTGIHLPDFCTEKRRDGYVSYDMSREKLMQTEKGREIVRIEDTYFQRTSGRNMDNGFCKSIHTYALIEHYVKDRPQLIDTINHIRRVEGNVRNLASHEIVSITDAWIKARCRLSSKEIMDKLIYLAREAGIVSSDDLWNSYDRMNRVIEETIIE